MFDAAAQVQFCVERAIELTLNQLSDTGDDDMLLRDALRDMIEVLVDDQVMLILHHVLWIACGSHCHPAARSFPFQLSLGTRIGYEISRKRPEVEGSVSSSLSA